MINNMLKAVKGSIQKEIIWYYTFIVILFKSVVFVGFAVKNNHLRPAFFTASRIIFTQTYYRQVFYLGFIAVFLAFAFLFRNRARIWYLLSFNLLVSVIFLIDMWYMRGYNTMTSLHLLKEAVNLGDMKDSVLSVVHFIDAVFIFDIPILAILMFVKKDIGRDDKIRLPAFAVIFVASILLMVTILPVNVNIFKVKFDDYVVSFYDPNITSNNISPIGYHVVNAYTYWKDTKPLYLTDQQKLDIKSWFEQKKETLPDNKYKAMFKGKNLIILQVESLENFVINQKVDGKELTPNLDRMLQNSLYFPNYYEQINNGMSSDADLLTDTSLYPIQSGSTFFRYPYTTYNSLPKLLKDEGYSSHAYYPVKGSFWNWMPAVKSIGYEDCIDSTHYDLTDSFGFGISDGSLFKQIEPMILKEKQPSFTFIITLSSHMPFLIPDKYKELNLSEEHENNKLGGYFESVRYTDKQIGMLLDTLKKDGQLDNSVIVVYGDHEGIHRFYPQDVPLYTPSEDWWMDNHKKLPLIIYNPSLAGEKIPTIGGQVDLLPTLCYLMGVDKSKYEDSAVGRNLLNTRKSFAVLADRKYIGEAANDKEKQDAIKGLDISDMLIRSDYFKK